MNCLSKIGIAVTIVTLTISVSCSAAGQIKPLPPGVEKVCSISFVGDPRHPARVEDSSLDCLDKLAQRLKASRTNKVVLVGTADPVKDHADDPRGEDRMKEDSTGTDLRFGDIAMYRSVNTKAYLVRWNHVNPARIIPTTDEWTHTQQVTFYLVPGNANFVNNYLGTTKTNESVCTVAPCPDPREERLTPQPRRRIVAK